ncbi:M23 family metallopeptidase [Methylocapsa aurea]|uniref:M23 family metallopeptidase n=1 Tax=Methylocapsa aurea TaxID=663610 RepID=UPI00055A0ABC|nr:M23 family metallopeptidase [Methylocapsa aurea]
MSHSVSIYCSRLAFRLALTSAAAGLLAGCASSDRLADPFGNPFQATASAVDPTPTSSIAPAAPVSPVQSRPLAAPSASPSPQPQPSFAQPNPAPSKFAQSSPRTSAGAPSGPTTAGWTATGGSPITVAQGENAEILSRRYGIPVDALVRTNGFSAAAQVQPGARVVIPVYNASLAASSAAPAPAPAAASHAAKVKILTGAAPASKLASTVAAPERTPPKPVKEAAQPKPPAKLVAAHGQDQTKEPVKEAAKGLAKEPVKEPAKNLAVAAKPPVVAGQPKAKPETEKVAKVETPVAEAKKPPQEAASAPTEAVKASADANPEFRWPARGRIIQAFKPGGNDGINIAVPEGTSVKAAESGVVAYAGSELKGYGNLILIRHPNGFVSAYANNGDIEVKRGETVKRGQTIAKSGQSGNVASPQLHFELRKGATPVDPTLYLAGL